MESKYDEEKLEDVDIAVAAASEDDLDDSKGLPRNEDGTWPIEARVSRFSTVQYQGKPITVFDIEVTWGDGDSWLAPHRYSEFAEFHEELAKKLSGLPKFPPKKYVFNLDAEFLEKRRRDLDQYVQALVKVRPVIEFPESSEFLQLKKNGISVKVPRVAVCDSNAIVAFRDPEFGFNDITFDVDLPNFVNANVAVTIEEDASAVSRFDSYLLNVKFPWEDDPPMVPVGCLVVWRKTIDNGEYRASCIRNFEHCASALTFCPITRRIFVGLSNGNIKRFVADEEFKSLRDEDDLFIHNERVTGLHYDSEKNILVSSARDKSIILTDTDRKRELDERVLDGTIMSMAVDPENERLFLGTTTGNITLVSYARRELRHLTTLQGHQNTVRSLYYEGQPQFRYLFSGNFDNSLSVWLIGPKGDESIARRVAILKGGVAARVKAVVFCPTSRFIISGHDNGLLTVWSSKNGSIINVIEAHEKSIVGLRWNDEAHQLLSVSRDGFCKLWQFTFDHDEETVVHTKNDLYARVMMNKS